MGGKSCYQSLRLDLELLTPAFVAGADQRDAVVTAGTVRGLLHWWWRAQVGHRFRDPSRLREAEAQLFGGTDPGRKSLLRVRVEPLRLKFDRRGTSAFRSGISYEYVRQGKRGTADILPYLAYGPVRPLFKQEKEPPIEPAFLDGRARAKGGPVLVRPALARGSSFAVHLNWRRGTIEDQQLDALVRAACAWVTLGGIGSRSRKGWGALDGRPTESSDEGLLGRARQLWEDERSRLLKSGDPIHSGRVPLFPILQYRVVVPDETDQPSWEKALGTIGKRYKELLPGPRASDRWIAGTASPRRASSLLVTVVREGDHRFRGVLCLLPCARDTDGSGAEAVKRFARLLTTGP